MRLENLTEGNGSYPTQTSDPTRRCGVAPQQGLTAPTPRHRDLRPVHKGEEIVAHRAGLVPPTYRRQPTIVMRPNLRPSERSERGRSPREKKVRRTSERGRAQRAKRAAAVRATHAEAFFFAGRGPGGGKIQQGRRAKKQ